MDKAPQAEKAPAPQVEVKPEAKPVEKKAFKGLYEALKETPPRWLPEEYLFAKTKTLSFADRLVTPPTKKKLIDPLFEPIFLLRLSYVTTESYRFVDETKQERKSGDVLRTFLGYREGFVLENFEIGFKGRHNETGVYYGGKLELVPREKDGTKDEGDFLKEVYVGWNYYSLADIQVGRIKVPIGQQLQKPTTEMPFTYAPLLDTLLPKRLLGARLNLSDPFKVLTISLGAFNTVKQPYEQLPDSKHLLLASRAELDVSNLMSALGAGYDRVFRLKFGGSFAQAKENYDPRTQMRYYGFDAHLDLFLLTVEYEYLFKDYYGEGEEANKALKGRGWHADATVHAWPNVLDLSLRYEEADNNTSTHMDYASDVSEAIKQKKRWVSAGLMLHATKQIDVAFNYIHRGEAEGRALHNDAFVTSLQFNL